MTTPNVNVEPAEQRLPLARRRSLVLALAGGAALASLPARAQSTAEAGRENLRAQGAINHQALDYAR